jgi:CRP-like cAMP-binding protein
MAATNFESDLQKLLLAGRTIKYRKGQVLQSSDDAPKLSLVVSGYVKRYLITNDGNLSVQSIYKPGYIFPLTLIYESILKEDIYRGNEVYYYETMSDAEIAIIDNDVLLQAVKENPLLYRDLLIVAGQRLHSNIQMLESMSLHTSYERVAHLLAGYARDFGVKTAAGIKIDLPLTHLLIANVLGITRETVSQSIIQLRTKKLIKTNQHITVPDLEKLDQETTN